MNEGDGGSAAILLAAGRGVRMGSDLPKVAHRVGGRPMVCRVADAARAAGFETVVVVVGYARARVEALLDGTVETVVQERQRGTGHAVRCAEARLRGRCARTAVLSGDVPLLRPETLRRLDAEMDAAPETAAVLLTMHVREDNRYGRIVRDATGDVAKIVEYKDADETERAICEVNAGTYLFETEALFASLARVSTANAQGEYYLTDVVALLKAAGRRVRAVTTDDPVEVMGVDTPEALARAEAAWAARRGDG